MPSQKQTFELNDYDFVKEKALDHFLQGKITVQQWARIAKVSQNRIKMGKRS